VRSGENLVKPEDELVFEYDNGYSLGLFKVEKISFSEYLFAIYLKPFRADCLAPDKCKVKPDDMPVAKSCCSSKGCC
jgi:hypothetical protein